jgi:hypothetical protein
LCPARSPCTSVSALLSDPEERTVSALLRGAMGRREGGSRGGGMKIETIWCEFASF